MLKKIVFKPGVNRENTRYFTEGGYYDCDKIRFRQGTPQKIGGWQKISNTTYLGVCRSLWNWITLNQYSLIGVGTNLKFYISKSGLYYDVTPIRSRATLSNPFTASAGSSVITVVSAAHGCATNDFVTYNGASSLGGTITAALLNKEYQVTFIDINTYTIDVGVAANSSDTGHGGTVYAAYQVATGAEYEVPNNGWGAGPWGYGSWGNGQPSNVSLQLWNQSNYGQDLIFGPRGGALYYWYADKGLSDSSITITIASPAVVTSTLVMDEATPIMFTTSGALPTGLLTGTVYYARNYNSVTSTYNISATPTGALINTSGTQSGTQYISPRGVNLTSLNGATDVPIIQNYLFVSDIYRFVFAFGCNDYGSTTQDPLLVRWSDQENAVDWSPTAVNQAGSVRLSHGSQIITCLQTRQELLVWTDSSLYSMQYLGPPYVWGTQLLGDNVSIVCQNAVALASGVVYWMGNNKFYKYDGRVQTLRCDLREFVFSNFNFAQCQQVCSGTNEMFNEVWWFYPSSLTHSTQVDRYVVYNYLEDIWYYGTMGRTAWLSTGTLQYPIAATYAQNIVNHEYGLDDYSTDQPYAIESYITTSEFDIDDGHNFVFVRRILPDVTFTGSTLDTPSVTMSISPMLNSGSGYTNPPSVGGDDYGYVTKVPDPLQFNIEKFTGQLFIRVRGRQFAFTIYNNQLGANWQLGAARWDCQLDGKRGAPGGAI